jgi:hypothetical protein
VLTIEIVPATRTIRRVKGRYNSPPFLVPTDKKSSLATSGEWETRPSDEIFLRMEADLIYCSVRLRQTVLTEPFLLNSLNAERTAPF